MELMFLVNSLAGCGLAIGVWQAVRVWNRLAKSGRWQTPMDGLNDQDFWHEFAKKAESQRSDAGPR